MNPKFMKVIKLITIFLMVAKISFGQDDGSDVLTPEITQNLKKNIEKQIPRIKQRIINEGLNSDQIEFYIDTFRIQQLVSKKFELVHSTIEMNFIIYEMASSYDTLLNKYYKKLLNALKPEDKKILINAQKAWITFRDAENKLIQTMSDFEYSGGGTIQNSMAIESYENMIEKRTIDIFNYFDSIIKDK
jgi:uncharacterized protein YecT (DUF1311 family)